MWIFSVMEDDEEEFPSTRNEEFLHNNNGKEKREKSAVFIVPETPWSPVNVNEINGGHVERCGSPPGWESHTGVKGTENIVLFQHRERLCSSASLSSVQRSSR